MKLKVVVADDNPAVLRQLVSLLETEFDVVCTAENGQGALECARRYHPDKAAQQAGALGYVFKARMTRDLIKAVKLAADGESFRSSS